MLGNYYPAIRDAAVSGMVAFLQQPDRRVNTRGLGFIAFAAPLLLVALIFIALGFFYWVEPLYGAGPALALTGLILLALGLWFLYIGRRMLSYEEPVTPAYSEQELAILIDNIAGDLESELDQTVTRNPKISVATAAIAGFLAGKGFLCR